MEAYLVQALSPSSGDHWSGPPEMVERIAAAAGTHSGSRVLDVGCGVGGPARRLAALVGCSVVALDVLPPLVRMARDRARREGRASGGVSFVVASGERAPFRARCFDQVWCLGVVAHVEDRAGLARSAAAALVAGGTLCVTELFWRGPRRPRFAAAAPWPWHPVSLTDLRLELRSAGFADVEVLPWPGRDTWSPVDVAHPVLRSDVLEGRLAAALVLARKP